MYRHFLLLRIWFLLANDTGAGKTIMTRMTRLLIKELLFRGVLQNGLIVTSGGLTEQWSEEVFQDKFGFYTRLINSTSSDTNSWPVCLLRRGLPRQLYVARP